MHTAHIKWYPGQLILFPEASSEALLWCCYVHQNHKWTAVVPGPQYRSREFTTYLFRRRSMCQWFSSESTCQSLPCLLSECLGYASACLYLHCLFLSMLASRPTWRFTALILPQLYDVSLWNQRFYFLINLFVNFLNRLIHNTMHFVMLTVDAMHQRIGQWLQNRL